jgi:putative ABC transport system substrate-binding protein
VKTRRKLIIAGGAALGSVAVPFACLAQQQGKVWRIGFLGSTSAVDAASRLDVFRAGLRDLGYVEGKNILIEYRWAEDKYERLGELAADLVRSRVDVIVTYGTPGTRAAKLATTTIPIVMTSSGDAVATGLVAGLARPGGNVTGLAFFSPEISAKRLEMLKEAVPRVTQVAYLLNPANSVAVANLKAMETTARILKIGLRSVEARHPGDLEGAFAAMASQHVDAVSVGQDSMLVANYRGIAARAAKQRLTSISSKEFAEAGGLIGYGHNSLELWRRGATYVDKIFKGARPADLPIEQPTRFELVVNMKTAKVLGVTIPQTVLVRADRVIE